MCGCRSPVCARLNRSPAIAKKGEAAATGAEESEETTEDAADEAAEEAHAEDEEEAEEEEDEEVDGGQLPAFHTASIASVTAW
jgi:hypothetical protein